jgi:hypothetical protein
MAQDVTTGPGLTAAYDPARNTVKIKWQQPDPAVVQYVLQRSSDNMAWKDIARLTITSQNRGKFVTFNDERVAPGRNYYRLQSFTSAKSFSFSESIMVIIGKKGGSPWLMYPVPVRGVLNLQYNSSELIRGVITVIIQNISTGRVLNRLRMASTTRLISIPVNNLGRGVYDIRIYISDKVVWNQRFNK